MTKHVIFLSSLLLLGLSLSAQNNLDVNFQTIPTFLNVCGNSDQEVVTVSVNANSSEIRSNIEATVRLFKGVELVSFNAAASSPGVTLIDGSDPQNPIIGIPDLDPTGINKVDIGLEVRALCEYIDTLQSGTGIFDVVDTWEITYDLETSNGLTESDQTGLYRDALAFPIFNVDVDNTFGPAKLNDCYSRDITIQNSGLAGFVDTLFYENIQGAGVQINSISVNGNPVTFSKAEMNGDTIISFGLSAAEFISIVGGDGDAFFDPNETVTITEDLCLIDCLGDRASTHNFSWGCESRFCETATAADFVTVGQGAPDVQINPIGSIPEEFVGYCQRGNKSLVFTNDGIEVDPGFATMLDVSVGISVGHNGSIGFLTDGAFTISEVYIAGVLITAPTYLIDLDNHPQFLGVDPDGPGVGLSDFDLDGYFDDLELGQSLEVTVYFDLDCSVAQGIDNRCENPLSTNFSGIANYTNLCGDRLERLNLNYSFVDNKRSEDSFDTDTDAFMDTDTFFLHLEERRKVDNFARSCSDSEVFRIQVVLPPGIDFLPGATTFAVGDAGSLLPLLSNVISNDTLYLEFDSAPPGLDQIQNLHDINLAFQANCTANVGPTLFPFQWSHYCPDCDCEHVWHCEEFVGPVIHTTNPPCPPLVCPVGVQSTGFDVVRTTFGFNDVNYTSPMDANSANTKAALACDSVEMSIPNIIGDTPLTDSIGMLITYNNPDGSLSADETFIFAEGNLEIIQGLTVTNCAVSTSDLTVTSIDSTKFLNFDLNNCLLANGITLMPGDQINFVGKFTINPDAPLESSRFSSVGNLRGYGYAIVDGVEYACDNYGDSFSIGSLQINASYPNASTQIRGCQEVALSVLIFSPLTDYTDVFGFEHRPVIKVDSVVIDYDPTILQAFGQFQPFYTMPDHPFYGDSPVPLPSLDNGTPGRYVIYLDTLDWGPSLVRSTATNPFNFTILAVPNCQTDFGNATGGNIYPFNPGLNFYEYAYALDYGDGSCANYLEESTVGQTIQYGNPPEMNFIPVSSPTYTLLRDTAEFTVQYCNTTNDADIGTSWFAIEDTFGFVEVVYAEDISLPTTPVQLTINNYGSLGNQYFMTTDGMKKVDGANGLEEICNTIRIKAIVTECGTLDFVAKAGWDCLVPDASWTPEDYDPCVDHEIPMSIIVREPFIDADIEQEPLTTVELCEENEIVVRVKNTQQGTLYDMESNFTLPIGVNLVPGSFEIAYPHTAAYSAIPSDPSANGSNALGDIFTYSDFAPLSTYLDDNGLRGDNAVMPTDSNEFLIRFRINTDCDFVAENRVYFSFTGVKSCGDVSNTESGETIPLSILGLPDPSDNSFDVGFEPGTGLVPGQISTIGINVTNTNANATDADDYIRIELPNNVIYQPGSSVGVQPSGWIPGDPVQLVNSGNIIYTWPLPIGLSQSETAILTFQVLSPTFACNISDLDVNLNTIVRTVVTCTATASTCEIEANTSSNNGFASTLNVLQPTLEFANVSYTSECLDGVSETVFIDGQLYNAGDPVLATNININFYFDNDGSGTIEGTEPLVGTTMATGPVPSLGTVDFSFTGAIDLTQICSIIAQVDTTGLGVCGVGETSLGDPVLLNAGDDELFCAALPTTISTNLGDVACDGLAGYTFSWSAIAPASTTDLSATDIANPLLTVPHDALVQDTLQYVLSTTRNACGSTLTTVDTVSIIRGIAVVLDVTSPVITSAGVPVMIDANPVSGVGPITYTWTPSLGLSDPSIANPIATVTQTTTFTVEATSAIGCSATANIVVTVENCIDPVANSIILTETNCAAENGSALIRLAQDEANYQFTWTPDIGTANAIGNERTDLPAGSYSVQVESIGIIGCDTEVNFIISAYDGPEVDTMTTAATCSAADGTATLTPSNLVYEWSDTGTGDTRTDLTAGTHYVTAYDAADPACYNVVEVKIGEISLLTATVTVNNDATSCTATDGSATINVLGGSGTYTFSWPSGMATDNNLGAGVHVVTITDTDPNACSTEVIFAINGGTDLVTVSNIATSDLLCAGDENGNIDFNVVFDPIDFVPTDTIITNGVDTFNNGMLPGGSYCILIVDATDCIGGSLCFDIVEPDPLQLVFTVTSPCPDNGEIELTVNGGSPAYMVDWSDIIGNNDIEDRTGLDVGTYAVIVTDANGCFVNENELILNTCPTACDYFFGLDTLITMTADCQDITTICLDITSDDISDFVVRDNGVIYTGNYVGCNFDTTFSYVYTNVILNLPAPYTVTSWFVGATEFSGDFADFQALTDSMNVWDPTGNWMLEATANSIIGGSPGTVYGSLAIESQSGFDVPPIEAFETISPNSLALEIAPGQHLIEVTDTTHGCSDLLYVDIYCPPYQQQYDTLCILEAGSFVIDTSRLNLEGTVISSSSICGTSVIDDPVIFSYDPLTWTIEYGGNIEGSDTACIEFTTDMGSIDTIFFYVTAEECVSYICDSVYILQTKEYCLDDSNLSGPITEISNICEDQSGTSAEVLWDLATGCVQFTGIELGIDSACIKFCDQFGNCDTTYLCFETVPYFDPPVANNDPCDSTYAGQPMVIDFKANDILFGGIDTAYILDAPQYGTIGSLGNNELNPDCTATYTADEDVCERYDEFSYVVCTPNGCDTATVCIWVQCSDIIIYTAVSPNGDGVNDVFYIGGIEEYENNTVQIFNRWGNLVYSTTGYKNEWDGKWNDSRDVPDGTYYYILNLFDEEGRVFNGYFELYR